MTHESCCKDETCCKDGSCWARAVGYPHLYRAFWMAIWPPGKMVVTLAAVILTAVWGALLDRAAGRAIHPNAVADYIDAQRSGLPDVPQAGHAGVFEVFRTHVRRCGMTTARIIVGALPGIAAPADIPPGAAATPWGNVRNVYHGVHWLYEAGGVVYWIFLVLGLISIWSLTAGLVCRMSALQLARGDAPDVSDGWGFAWPRRLNLFFVPMLPALAILAIHFGIYVFGLIVRIPWLGDLATVVLIPMTLGFGLLAALIAVGAAPAVSLAWPAVAVDDADCWDAVAGRGYAYAYQRPFRTVVYFGIAAILGAVTVLLMYGLAWLSLRMGHHMLGGTSGGPAAAAAAELGKIDRIWPMGGSYGFFSWSASDAATGMETVAAFFVGAAVALVRAGLWAFAASFYFTAATAIYLFLRREVDGVELSEITENDEQSSPPSPPPQPGGAERRHGDDTGEVSLPVPP